MQNNSSISDSLVVNVYLAAPFFNPEQVAYVDTLESVMDSMNGISLYSPRRGDNAIAMNTVLSCGGTPLRSLRCKVFSDNCLNIDSADLVIAVIDERDVGVIFEVGYAYRSQVPIVTITNKNFGMNLMLAESTIGHIKSIEELRDVLNLSVGRISKNNTIDTYGQAIGEIQSKYLTTAYLTEGPNERKQS